MLQCEYRTLCEENDLSSKGRGMVMEEENGQFYQAEIELADRLLAAKRLLIDWNKREFSLKRAAELWIKITLKIDTNPKPSRRSSDQTLRISLGSSMLRLLG